MDYKGYTIKQWGNNQNITVESSDGTSAILTPQESQQILSQMGVSMNSLPRNTSNTSLQPRSFGDFQRVAQENTKYNADRQRIDQESARNNQIADQLRASGLSNIEQKDIARVASGTPISQVVQEKNATTKSYTGGNVAGTNLGANFYSNNATAIPQTNTPSTTSPQTSTTEKPPKYAPFAISSNLQYGSRGQEVEDLQRYLQGLQLYDGKIDGIYGNQTLTAVKTFQQQKGLTADGVVGKNTVGAINNTQTNTQTNGGAGSSIESMMAGKYLVDFIDRQTGKPIGQGQGEFQYGSPGEGKMIDVGVNTEDPQITEWKNALTEQYKAL